MQFVPQALPGLRHISLSMIRALNGFKTPVKSRFPATFSLTLGAFGRWFRLVAALRQREFADLASQAPQLRPFPSPRDKERAMSKKDLIEAVATVTALSKEQATQAVDAVISHIQDSMKRGEEVRIPGFGTFKVTKRAARKARNPQTGVEMMLKASVVPKFSASKNLKEALN
jgi:DNA-binding protein HU-beta